MRIAISYCMLAIAWAVHPRTYTLRYLAARFALSCAEGKGADAPPPAERPAYRQQALDHLTAVLATMRKRAASDRTPVAYAIKDRTFVHWRMKAWLVDEDLASVRDPRAVGRLPPDERDAWTRLWADVRDLRDRTAPQSDSPQSAR